MIDGFDNDEDTEYVEIEEDMDIFEESREPITVSYVTEDGKEVFQMVILKVRNLWKTFLIGFDVLAARSRHHPRRRCDRDRRDGRRGRGR